ncbi:hypothetical protein Tcan_01465 [Toxocara canis]|uniref:Uncharacterized protein n=1 Tax=Toxocara canis TaxID=6265 RepID=A0A0B2VWF8_TOXCA|nr:hypothetical protein Tcan_01465 [Toxocara canis]
MSDDRKEKERLISEMTAELERRKAKRVPTPSDLTAIRYIVPEIGTRSTSGIVRRREQYIQRLKLIENRVELRRQEGMRKAIRKKFAAKPSMQVLLEETDDSPSERPSLKSVMDFWKPLIGTRAPSKPETVPAMQIGTRSTSGIVRRREQYIQRLKLIENRVELRKQEGMRKAIRKKFAAKPSMQVLLEETDDSPSERPSLKSVMDVWRPLIGTRAPSKPETVPAMQIGTRSTSGIVRRREQYIQRLKLIENRVELRKQEGMRKAIRKKFAAKPSMQVLLEETDDSPSERPSLKSVMDFWKPLIGTRAPSKPETVPAMQIGTRSTSGIVRRREQYIQRLKLIENRVELRKQEGMRKAIRKKFAAKPSMQVLLEETDDSPSERPSLKSVMDFWKPLIGTRAPSKPETVPAMQIGTRSTSGIVRRREQYIQRLKLIENRVELRKQEGMRKAIRKKFAAKPSMQVLLEETDDSPSERPSLKSVMDFWKPLIGTRAPSKPETVPAMQIGTRSTSGIVRRREQYIQRLKLIENRVELRKQEGMRKAIRKKFAAKPSMQVLLEETDDSPSERPSLKSVMDFWKPLIGTRAPSKPETVPAMQIGTRSTSGIVRRREQYIQRLKLIENRVELRKQEGMRKAIRKKFAAKPSMQVLLEETDDSPSERPSLKSVMDFWKPLIGTRAPSKPETVPAMQIGTRSTSGIVRRREQYIQRLKLIENRVELRKQEGMRKAIRKKFAAKPSMQVLLEETDDSPSERPSLKSVMDFWKPLIGTRAPSKPETVPAMQIGTRSTSGIVRRREQYIQRLKLIENRVELRKQEGMRKAIRKKFAAKPSMQVLLEETDDSPSERPSLKSVMDFWKPLIGTRAPSKPETVPAMQIGTRSTSGIVRRREQYIQRLKLIENRVELRKQEGMRKAIRKKFAAKPSMQVLLEETDDSPSERPSLKSVMDFWKPLIGTRAPSKPETVPAMQIGTRSTSGIVRRREQYIQRLKLIENRVELRKQEGMRKAIRKKFAAKPSMQVLLEETDDSPSERPSLKSVMDFWKPLIGTRAPSKPETVPAMQIGTRSTSGIVRRREQYIQRLKLIENRVELRKQEGMRKAIRKKFAAKPSMQVLLEETDDSPSERPSLKSVMDFWKPLIGTRAPSKPETVPAMQIGTRSTSGIVRRREQYIQRLKLIENRVELRKQEGMRKAIRKKFAAKPSMQVLLEETDDSPSERPSLKSVMDFWKPLIGTRAPSKPETVPAMQIGTRSTSGIVRRREQYIQRLKLIENRVELRKQEGMRKAIRKKFAAKPSMQVLLEETDDSPSERPSLKSVMDFWKPLIGTRAPSKPETVPAMQIGTRSTSGIVRRREQYIQRLKLIENRVELRKQEGMRKAIRKKFAAKPSMQVLLEETDDSPSERPSLKSVMEEDTLKRLCLQYEGILVNWSAVMQAFCAKHAPRTKAALAAKWAVLRRINAQLITRPPIPDAVDSGERQTTRAPAREGEPKTENETDENPPLEVTKIGGKSVTATPEIDGLNEKTPQTEVTKNGGQSVTTTTEIDGVSEPAQRRGILVYTTPASPDDQTYQAFLKVFYGHFRWAVARFDREPAKRVGTSCTKTLLWYADSAIREVITERKTDQSEIGRLNAAVYAAAQTVHQFWREATKPRRQKEAEWFRKMSDDRKEKERLISEMTAELERRKAKRVPTPSDLTAIRYIVPGNGTRSTSGIVRRREQYIQRLKLIENRVEQAGTEGKGTAYLRNDGRAGAKKGEESANSVRSYRYSIHSAGDWNEEYIRNRPTTRAVHSETEAD